MICANILCCSNRKCGISEQSPSVPEIMRFKEGRLCQREWRTCEDIVHLVQGHGSSKYYEVNGQDLSGATHEEAIKVFNAAKEPIIVEVVKRPDPDKSPTNEYQEKKMSSSATSDTLQSSKDDSPPPPPTPPEVTTEDVFTQTDWPISSGFPWLQASSSDATRFIPPAYLVSVPGLSFSNESDQCDPEAVFNYIPSTCLMEYEEVTLTRTNGENEKLGLTLCYGTPEDPETDIFISEIDPESIAGQCGLIRVGDQILQINNIDVNTREQAVSLFSEKTTDVTLLLARPQLQLEDLVEDDEDDGSSKVKELGREPTIDEEDEGTTDTGTGENGSTKHEKDSGVGRTDESTKNDESSEHEDLADNELTSPGTNSGNNELVNSNESITSQDITWAEEGEHVETEYEDKCIGTSSYNLASESQDENGCEHTMTQACSHGSIDRELAILNQEMKNIQIECQSLVQKHANSTKGCKDVHNYVNLPPVLNQNNKPHSSSKSIDKSRSVAEWIKSTSRSVKLHKPLEENTTSSAYNTGESCRSTPLTMELNADRKRHGSMMSLVAPPSTEEKGTQFVPDQQELYSVYSCESCRQCREERDRRRGKHSNHEYRTLPARCDKDQPNFPKYVSVAPSETMYTNEANLEHTIWLQQQMFMQAMEQQRRRTLNNSDRSARFGEPNLRKNIGMCKESHSKGKTLQNIEMEWRVKKRADGSRYITRRPVRNKILKQRAQKIMEERAGITTDDDAMSEMKTGRYWTKEDRKKQLEQARMYKLRREIMKAKMMESVKEHEPNILAQVHNPSIQMQASPIKQINTLDQKKSRKKAIHTNGHFEEFSTVQEVLAHGSRVSSPKPNGLLSVTTV